MISVKIFVFNSFQVNTYVLNDTTKEAIIIDPACESEHEFAQLFDYLESKGLHLKTIVNTHAHIDHIVGVEMVKKKFNVPFYLHAGDKLIINAAEQSATLFGFKFDAIPVVEKFIDENTTIEFGKSSLQAFHVPGHSPGSMVYYSPIDKFVIVGDVLFNGSVGRTDLPGGDYNTLISGIKQKLLTLPLDTVVYSGHGPTTTIKHEHDTNPFLV